MAVRHLVAVGSVAAPAIETTRSGQLRAGDDGRGSVALRMYELDRQSSGSRGLPALPLLHRPPPAAHHNQNDQQRQQDQDSYRKNEP